MRIENKSHLSQPQELSDKADNTVVKVWGKSKDTDRGLEDRDGPYLDPCANTFLF